MAKNKKEKSFVIKEVDGFEIRSFVREAIMPEIVEALKESLFKEDFKNALGINKEED